VFRCGAQLPASADGGKLAARSCDRIVDKLELMRDGAGDGYVASPRQGIARDTD